MYDLFVISDSETDWEIFKEKFPHAKRIESSSNSILQCAEQSFTSMFWIVNYDFILNEKWNFSFVPEIFDQNYIHTWQIRDNNGQELFDEFAIQLIPRKLILENKTSNTNFFESGGLIKQMPDIIGWARPYDLFFVWDNKQQDNEKWIKILQRFPHAQKIPGTRSMYRELANLSRTEMFYVVESGWLIDETWDFTYIVPSWDKKYIHTWQGYHPVSRKPLNLFPVKLVPTTLIKNTGDIVGLFETDGHIKPMTEQIAWQEIHDLFFIWEDLEFGESDIAWNSVLSRFPHAKKIPGSTNVYVDAALHSCTEMFYIVEPGYEIEKDWDFSYTAPWWDIKWIHTWPSIYSNTGKLTGKYPVKLVPKNLILESTRHIDELFESIGHIKPMTECIAIKKLHDLFFIWPENETYENHTLWKMIKNQFPHAQCINGTADVYEIAANLSTTDMFFIAEPDYDFDQDWNFTYTAPMWDKNYIHSWQAFTHSGNSLDKFPVKLLPKQLIIDNTENITDLFENAGFIKPMQEKIVFQERFDIFFVSFNEPNADKHWEILRSRFPQAKRVHGIIGIDNAHKACARMSTSNMFWTIDGDTVIDENFLLDYNPSIHDRNYIHIWLSRNPVNGLEYGYGAIKLWPKSKVEEYDGSWLDYTISVGQIKIINQTVATTYFNSSPFESWKSAFRECVKLVRNIKTNPDDTESKTRLDTWMKVKNDVPFAAWCITGTNDAIEWFQSNKNNLHYINNFRWLEDRFKELHCNT